MANNPLACYRSKSKINYEALRMALYTEDLVQYKENIWRTLETDPVFAHSSKTPALEEQRKITFERVIQLLKHDFLSNEALMENPMRYPAYVSAIGMYDWSLLAKKSLMYEFCSSAIRGSGTKDQAQILEQFQKEQVIGCFCLTEVSHGSNTKAMRTTAKFDVPSQRFILNTPDFQAAKVWSGNLSKTATHAIVFAQLIPANGQSCGLHSFIVPIRDPKTLLPKPRVTIGDMGEKVGLNGLDNGFMIFDHYAIEKSCLLNKLGDVNPQGEYVSPFKDPNRRFGASLGALSSGRTGIMTMANANLHLAIVIAMRYSASRQQFGSNHQGEELSVLEYQAQHCRLMPILASAFVHHVLGMSFFQDFIDFNVLKLSKSEDPAILAAMGMEIHGISSAGKPLTSWTAQQALQECREACGGHGYLKCARLGDLRNDNDANCTYEGDNNVLLQQTSNWLSTLDPTSPSPLGSTSFLERKNELELGSFNFSQESPLNIEDILVVYQMLLTRLIKAFKEVNAKIFSTNGGDKFDARNRSQTFLGKTLSVAFIEHFALKRYHRWLKESQNDLDKLTTDALNNLGLLYGLVHVEQKTSSLLKCGILVRSKDVDRIHEDIIAICLALKNDAIVLTDVLAPSDFILNSSLANFNGDIYTDLEQAFTSDGQCFQRPEYWKNQVDFLRSKL
ncbi:peroxisomal acyl-coenzyme A oxidase 3-like [Tigriopus californicus]|uniref:peroxisomal acyl-coenzyme A oxidase 3-like n=1 Tax=Tigriopus californicus TaxID=6832 RepID=UPI0027DA06EA|nr:peroxisomal acyl-coenzyme A oxidase 3-like [Tigriopus californicus]